MKSILWSTFLALLFLSGIALAGSDGEWFPLPNLAGLALMGAFALIAAAERRRPHV